MQDPHILETKRTMTQITQYIKKKSIEDNGCLGNIEQLIELQILNKTQNIELYQAYYQQKTLHTF